MPSVGTRTARRYAVRVAALALLVSASHLHAEGDAEGARRRGAILIANAGRWMNGGSEPEREVRTVYLDLQDVLVADGASHHEGFLRIWYRAPDAFRLEQRPERGRANAVTKVLTGERLVFVTPDGRTRDAGRDADGARARAQLTADRSRFADLARYLTLSGLDGEGVRFIDLGLVEPNEAGLPRTLRHVRREHDAAPPIDLYFETADPPRTVGDLRRVREAPDPVTKSPERRFRFDGWRADPAGRRVPGRVEGEHVDDAGRGQRTMLAFPVEVRVNTDLPAALFSPK